MGSGVLFLVAAGDAGVQAGAAGLALSPEFGQRVTVAEAVRSGSLQRILAALPPDGSSVVRTAFPGDGGAVTQETARQEITALVVSDAGRSDAFGDGAYTLLAVWRPSINPGETLLIGSGIGTDGAR